MKKNRYRLPDDTFLYNLLLSCDATLNSHFNILTIYSLSANCVHIKGSIVMNHVAQIAVKCPACRERAKHTFGNFGWIWGGIRKNTLSYIIGGCVRGCDNHGQTHGLSPSWRTDRLGRVFLIVVGYVPSCQIWIQQLKYAAKSGWWLF